MGAEYKSHASHDPYKYMEEDKIYHMNLASVPTWYHTSVCIFLSFLGAFGILLNGFVICCFLLRPNVRYDQTLILKAQYNDIIRIRTSHFLTFIHHFEYTDTYSIQPHSCQSCSG